MHPHFYQSRSLRFLVYVSISVASVLGANAASVLEYQGSATREGHFVSPQLTRNAVAHLQADPGFQMSVNLEGPFFAQPLYVENGSHGKNILLLASEKNQIYAIDADSGQLLWQKFLGIPAVSLRDLPCGNIDPMGVTGTPVVDAATKTLYVNAMTSADNGRTIRHKIYAVSIEDGILVPGGQWPIDVQASLRSLGVDFDSRVHGQRGALTIKDGFLYVPYGGHFGDCGDYHGRVVQVPLNNPSHMQLWSTIASRGGIWAPGGVSSDGRDLFVTTGNTSGTTRWGGGNAVNRLGPSIEFSIQSKDFFAPTDWKELDDRDADLATAPLFTQIPAPNSNTLSALMAFGKDGRIVVLDPANLGGIGGALASKDVARSVFASPTAYKTSSYSAVVFNGEPRCPAGGLTGGDVAALKISVDNDRSVKVSTLWCSGKSLGRTGLISSTTDGLADSIVWGIQTSGSGHLIAFNGDTGQVLFEGSEARSSMSRFQTPIIANGKVFVLYNNTVRAYKP